MSIAVVFPGQGSQFVGMADVWAEDVAGNAVLTEASEALGRDLVQACQDEDFLAQTDLVQPAILACDLAAFRAVEAAGVRVTASAGHSLGEFAALVAAGVLHLAEALRIVVVRGRAMQEAGERQPGTMTALLGLGPQEAAALCELARGNDVLVVANENAPQQVVVSGSVPAIERVEELAANRRARAVRLSVAGAFHSPLMERALEPISVAIDDAVFSNPRFPIAANVTGEIVEDPTELRSLLKRHVVSPVRWDACAKALAAAGADTFIEAGPGDVLTKLAKRVVPSARAVAVGSPEAADRLASELA